MKKIILAIAATMTMTAAMAQGNNQQEGSEPKKLDKTEMVKKRTDDTAKKYGLNDQQKEQLLSLNTKYADKIGGPRGMRPGRGGRPGARQGQNGNGQRPQMTEEQRQEMQARFKEMNENMKAYDAELQKIMTPEQYKSYQADMAKMRNRGQRGGQRRSRNADAQQ